MNRELEFYAAHSPITNPGAFHELLKTLPEDVPALCMALRGLILHYVGSRIQFSPERLALIDSRRVETILANLAALSAAPLSQARAAETCFVGCCRDFATLFVAFMRERGIPARTRVGFAPYINIFPNFNLDHVVAEYWNGSRWVMVDPQFEPGFAPFDLCDMPAGVFASASSVWQGYRHGSLNPEAYGVHPDLPFRGAWFIRNYVMLELAALNKVETLLWDNWGEMNQRTVVDAALMDRAAEVMLTGDWQAIRGLYQDTPALQMPGEVMCYSPTGYERLEVFPLT